MQRFLLGLSFVFMTWTSTAALAAPQTAVAAPPTERELESDRPGSTNSPSTIEPGQFQLEVELVNASTRIRSVTDAAQLSEQQSYLTPTLRAGVTSSTELQISWTPRLTQVSDPLGPTRRSVSGYGDMNLRLKKNLNGNAEGDFAWALMPGVKIPTAQGELGNHEWEPTLMLPITIRLPSAWSLSLMPEIDVRKNAQGSGFHTESIAPLTFGHHLFAMLDGYFEYVSHATNEKDSAAFDYVGAGVSARIDKKVQIDAGCNFGLNAVTPRFNPLAGMTVLF
jgi:hypothetical protein